MMKSFLKKIFMAALALQFGFSAAYAQSLRESIMERIRQSCAESEEEAKVH
jgi:hypothetical protein